MCVRLSCCPSHAYFIRFRCAWRIQLNYIHSSTPTKIQIILIYGRDGIETFVCLLSITTHVIFYFAGKTIYSRCNKLEKHRFIHHLTFVSHHINLPIKFSHETVLLFFSSPVRVLCLLNFQHIFVTKLKMATTFHCK